MKNLVATVFGMGLLASPALAQQLELNWPTPNKAWSEGKTISAYLQDAGTSDPASGGFGGVRTSGKQFHEGMDLKALHRDRRGEATDPVFAAMDGVVRHVNGIAGNSSYGRYIVLEHPTLKPAVYTLYAHLAKIAPGINAGASVRRGQTLGVMGRSAGGYSIPKQRAHLHFEIGVLLTRGFQRWYDWKDFGSQNGQGIYNGMNLMGVDPLDFFNRHRERRIISVQDYFDQMRPAVKLRIATKQIPDYVQRYPTLVAHHLPILIAGWEIEINWTGLPYRWVALDATAVKGMQPNEVKIIYVDSIAASREKSKRLVATRQGKQVPDRDLETVLQLLFGRR